MSTRAQTAANMSMGAICDHKINLWSVADMSTDSHCVHDVDLQIFWQVGPSALSSIPTARALY